MLKRNNTALRRNSRHVFSVRACLLESVYSQLLQITSLPLTVQQCVVLYAATVISAPFKKLRTIGHIL